MKTFFHNKFRQYKCQYFYDAFKYYGPKCKSLIQSNYLGHLNEVQPSLKSNPKRFWSYVQTKKGKPRIPVMKFSNEELPTSPELVKTFASFCKSVYVISDSSYSCVLNHIDLSNSVIKIEKVTVDEILLCKTSQFFA